MAVASLHEAVTRLDDSIGIKVSDSSMISTHWLVDDFHDLAEKKGIKVQLEVLPLGGTDGGAVQRRRAGVPIRYIHTVVESVNADDVRAGVDRAPGLPDVRYTGGDAQRAVCDKCADLFDYPLSTFCLPPSELRFRVER